jgi:hypothetical protein
VPPDAVAAGPDAAAGLRPREVAAEVPGGQQEVAARAVQQRPAGVAAAGLPPVVAVARRPEAAAKSRAEQPPAGAAVLAPALRPERAMALAAVDPAA